MIALAACTGSEDVRVRRDSGAVTSSGEAGSGAGTAGAAPSDPSGSGGEAATAGSSGTAGTSPIAGTSGIAGTTGAGAGSGTGTGGRGGSTGGTQGGTAGVTGAGGTTNTDAGSADPGVEITYTNTIGNTLTFYCGGCHLGTNVQSGFSISYANLMAHVSGATSGCTALDSSKARVVPGKPANSLIYIKMSNASPPSGCGGHMPSQGNTVPANQQQIIHDWIMAGAKE